MELSELKNKAFDIRAEIDKIDAGIQKANEQKAKLINEYNPVAQEIFKLENEAKKKSEAKPGLKLADGYQPEDNEEKDNPPKKK